MILLLELLMVAAVLLFIGRPFFIKEYDAFALETAEGEHREDLLQKKEYAFETLSDLDLDFKTGKISEEDFITLKKRYEHEAIEVLKEIDHLDKEGKRLEKKGPESPPEKQNESNAQEPVSKEKGHFCTQCGTASKETDRFCSHCGNKIQP
ncbi:MAG: hypothetical protein ACE5FU_02920 [Nitrospinota bacterium]